MLANNNHWNSISIDLKLHEKLHILEPKSIVFFDGKSEAREDKLFTIKEMLKGKSILKSIVSGPTKIILSVNSSQYITLVDIKKDEDMLYEFKNILFYDNRLVLEHKWQPIVKAVATKSLSMASFKGNGIVGIMSKSPIYSYHLQEDKPVFVNIKNLISLPAEAQLGLCTYGKNPLTAQNSDINYEITGKGILLVETGTMVSTANAQISNDNIIVRLFNGIIDKIFF